MRPEDETVSEPGRESNIPPRAQFRRLIEQRATRPAQLVAGFVDRQHVPVQTQWEPLEDVLIAVTHQDVANVGGEMTGDQHRDHGALRRADHRDVARTHARGQQMADLFATASA
jgi:hypothetical protein